MNINDIVLKELTRLNTYQEMQNNQGKMTCYKQDYYYYFRCKDKRIIVEIPDEKTAHIYSLTTINNDFVSQNEILINVIDGNNYVKDEITNEFNDGKIHSVVSTVQVNQNFEKEVYNEKQTKLLKHEIKAIKKRCKKILDTYEV